ncbi:MAG: hypothetical protein IKR33_04305 [Bacteroidales bacterium]|nr:hypothetical protein [Bacteroidales bacterium]
MKKTIKMLLTAMLLAFGGTAMGQIQIPGTHISFELEPENWRYLRTFQLDDGADIFLYYYVGEVIVDTEGDTVLPFLRIYVNEEYSGDVYELAYDRYMLQPFQSLHEYTHGPGLPRSGGIGYIGAYTNPTEQKDYQFMMTYFTSDDAIVEFRLETTKDTFEEMESEFKTILSTVK